jgi:hypothetical protein
LTERKVYMEPIKSLPLSVKPAIEGVTPTPRNMKIVDLLRQLEYLKRQLKQLLDT